VVVVGIHRKASGRRVTGRDTEAVLPAVSLVISSIV